MISAVPRGPLLADYFAALPTKPVALIGPYCSEVANSALPRTRVCAQRNFIFGCCSRATAQRRSHSDGFLFGQLRSVEASTVFEAALVTSVAFSNNTQYPFFSRTRPSAHAEVEALVCLCIHANLSVFTLCVPFIQVNIILTYGWRRVFIVGTYDAASSSLAVCLR